MAQQRQPQKKRKPQVFTTEVFGLMLKLDPGREDHLGFVFRTPQGRETTRWTKVEPDLLRMIKRQTDPHVEHKEFVANMSEAEKAEYFKETGGGS